MPIPDATLNFRNFQNGPILATANSHDDGTFTSPPLACGHTDADRRGRVGVQVHDLREPEPDSQCGAFAGGPGTGVGIRPAEGEVTLELTVHLTDDPVDQVPVHVDVYQGYFIGGTDQASPMDTGDGFSDEEFAVSLSDWGPLTVRVSAGEATSRAATSSVFDNPMATRTITVNLDPVE